MSSCLNSSACSELQGTIFNDTTVSKEKAIIIAVWYSLVSIIGIPGNIIVLLTLITSSKKMKSIQIIIFWIAIVDICGCSLLPVKYSEVVQRSDQLVSVTYCSSVKGVQLFIIYWELFLFVSAAFERYLSVRMINQNVHVRRQTAFKLVCISTSAAAMFTLAIFIPVVLQNLDNRMYCTPHPSPNVLTFNKRIVGLIPYIIFIGSVTILYSKIVILLRKRTSQDSKQHAANQQLGTNAVHRENGIFHVAGTMNPTKFCNNKIGSAPEVKNGLPVRKEQRTCKEFLGETSTSNPAPIRKEQRTCKAAFFGERSTTDPDPVQYVSSKKNKNGGSSVNIIKVNQKKMGANTNQLEFTDLNDIELFEINECVQHRNESDDNERCLDYLQDIPGVVDNSIQVNNTKLSTPKVHTVVDSIDDQDQATPDIPELPSEPQNKSKPCNKVTLMLFIATLVGVCFCLFALFGMAILEPAYAIFIYELFLINFAVNPFIYSFVNVGFRKDCLSHFQKLTSLCSHEA